MCVCYNFAERFSLTIIDFSIDFLILLGLIKTAIGVTAGGAVGMLLFRTGGGWRSACAAAGLGVAMGSTYERMIGNPSSKKVE